MNIHLWCPGAYETDGGIEAYSAALVGALAENNVQKITVLAKHDSLAALRRSAPNGVLAAGTGDVPLRLRTPAFAALLVGRAVAERPDLIITTHLNFAPVAAWLKRRFAIPYWISLHGIEAWDLQHPSRRQALRSADLLLSVSRFTRERVRREQGIAPEQFRILHDTFEPAAWEVGPKPDYLLKRYKLAPATPVILTVARLSAAEAYKGQDRVLRVLKNVAERMRNAEGEIRNELEGDQAGETSNVERRTSNAEMEAELERRKSKVENQISAGMFSPFSSSPLRYVIVGDGDDRSRLERIAVEEGVGDLVTFAGRVPQEELADHYRLCDLFAMPSSGEGFGIVFLEALACGRPVLAGKRDASADPLRDGELGLLVDPDDPAQLCDAIISVLDKTLADPLIHQPDALRRKAIEYFGFGRFRETLATILRDFVRRQRSDA